MHPIDIHAAYLFWEADTTGRLPAPLVMDWGGALCFARAEAANGLAATLAALGLNVKEPPGWKKKKKKVIESSWMLWRSKR